MLTVQSIVLFALGCALSFGFALLLIRRHRLASPTHAAAKTEVVTDLDAILGRTVGVRFHGRVHRIPPLSFEDFLRATNAMAEFEMLGKERVVSVEQLKGAYVRLFEICCPSILEEKRFSELNNQQMAALYKTIFDQLVGRPNLEAQKKSQLESDSARTNLSAS